MGEYGEDEYWGLFADIAGRRILSQDVDGRDISCGGKDKTLLVIGSSRSRREETTRKGVVEQWNTAEM